MSSWVLLRGLGRESRHWGDFPEKFARESGAASVITPDLPGSGLHWKQRSPLSVAGIVDAVRADLATRGVKPAFNLLALSLGGMVATDWAQRFPAEVGALVLINTSQRPHAGLTQRLRPQSWATLASMAIHWRDGDTVEQAVHSLTCERDARREDDLRQWRFIRDSAPVSRANVLRQLWAAARFRAVRAPVCPVLVMSSSHDRLVNPVCSDHLATAWRAKHLQHHWAGHDLPHDDADWVCREVAAWSTRLRPSSAPVPGCLQSSPDKHARLR